MKARCIRASLTRAPDPRYAARVPRAVQRRQHGARCLDAGGVGARTRGPGAAPGSTRHLPAGDCRRPTRLAAHRPRGAIHGRHAARPGSGSGVGVPRPSTQSLVQLLSVERPRRVPDGTGPARRGPRLPPRSRTGCRIPATWRRISISQNRGSRSATRREASRQWPAALRQMPMRCTVTGCSPCSRRPSDQLSRGGTARREAALRRQARAAALGSSSAAAEQNPA